MKYKFLTGDINWQTYGGKFISHKLNNGDFDYWLVMEVINWHEYEESPKNTYSVEVTAIAPSELPEEVLNSAWKSWGIEGTLQDAIKRYGKNFLVELVSGYMGGAIIFQESGNNLRDLMRKARKGSDLMGSMLFGFTMDKYQNAIGSTGWDILKGNITAGLYRTDDNE